MYKWRKLIQIFVDFYHTVPAYGFREAYSDLKERLTYWRYWETKDRNIRVVDDAIHYAMSNMKDWKDKSIWSCLKEWDQGLGYVVFLLKYRKKSKLTWEQVCDSYLKRWGWNKKAREDFYKWGEYGFNLPCIGVNNPCDFSEFLSELHYCSDRMSMDRLFRCHVLFRNIREE